MLPIRTLAVAATDHGPLAPEPAAGIGHGKSAQSISVGAGKSRTLRQAQALLKPPDITILKSRCAAPVRGGGAHRWAPFGRIHA